MSVLTMPSFRAYSEVSHTSFHDFSILLYSIVVFVALYVVFRKLMMEKIEKNAKNTTIIEVKTPKRIPGTPMDTPIHITVNITHRVRSMSEFQLPPPAPKSAAAQPETKKDM